MENMQQVLYIVIFLAGLYWLLRQKRSPRDDYYQKILDSDEYKVKGRFESSTHEKV